MLKPGGWTTTYLVNRKDIVAGLFDAAREGGPVEIDAELSVDDGQRLQLEVLGRWQDLGEQCTGYKVGLTSGVSRNAFGEGVRPFGFILASRVMASADQLYLPKGWRFGLENELVFRVDQLIEEPAQADARQIRECMTSVAPAFEINHHRLKGQAGPGIRVADNLSQWGIVAGVFIPVHQVDFDAIEVALARNGQVVETVAAAGHIDDHFVSLATLARRLAAFDRTLNVGDVVITGAFTRQEISDDALWRADIRGVGEVSIDIRQET
jgi:2-keto-4-pentenoate hydratase